MMKPSPAPEAAPTYVQNEAWRSTSGRSIYSRKCSENAETRVAWRRAHLLEDVAEDALRVWTRLLGKVLGRGLAGARSATEHAREGIIEARGGARARLGRLLGLRAGAVERVVLAPTLCIRKDVVRIGDGLGSSDPMRL